MNIERFTKKERAIALRKKGVSIRAVEQTLSIPRSTLSGWFKNIQLTADQKRALEKKSHEALKKARLGAVKWHNAQKAQRCAVAEEEALNVLRKIKTEEKHILELALAIMYLGEGSKKNAETALGSSDPMILRFFLAILTKVYNYNIDNVHCELALRADQKVEKEKRYWSQILDVPIERFTQAHLDKRTTGKKTYKDYHGVCNVRCGRVDIQRRLFCLAKGYCDSIVKTENKGL